MNIIRLDNVKSSLATSYSLTLNIEKYKDLKKPFTIVILNESDINNINSLIKLRGVSITILIIPQKFKFTFNETKYYNNLMTQLDEDYKITYF